VWSKSRHDGLKEGTDDAGQTNSWMWIRADSFERIKAINSKHHNQADQRQYDSGDHKALMISEPEKFAARFY